mmetsp:Transcript_22125/g.45247  ORF Transcript_22125/g.45247 Transcript_22125/m.45247 type:complete len:183 (-) Transcript_22125:229-777(-)
MSSFCVCSIVNPKPHRIVALIHSLNTTGTETSLLRFPLSDRCLIHTSIRPIIARRHEGLFKDVAPDNCGSNNLEVLFLSLRRHCWIVPSWSRCILKIAHISSNFQSVLCTRQNLILGSFQVRRSAFEHLLRGNNVPDFGIVDMLRSNMNNALRALKFLDCSSSFTSTAFVFCRVELPLFVVA